MNQEVGWTSASREYEQEELKLEALDVFDSIIEEGNPWPSDGETNEDSGESSLYNWDEVSDSEEESSDEHVAPDSNLGTKLRGQDRPNRAWTKSYNLSLQWEEDCVEMEDVEDVGEEPAASVEHSLSIDKGLPRQSYTSSFPILKLPLELRDKIYAAYLEMDVYENVSSKRNSPSHSMAVYRLEPNKIDARQDTDDDAYLNKSTLREILTSPLLQSCQQVRTEALEVFYRHTQFVVCSIPDLNIFTQAIGHQGQQLLRHIHLYDPLYSMWSEENITLVLQALSTNCPSLKTFHIQFDEQDMLFPTLRDEVEALPEYFRMLDQVFDNPRIGALFQLSSKVKISFEVDFTEKRRKEYEFLKDVHLLTQLPLWIGRFYSNRKVWSDMIEEWQKRMQ